MIERFDMFTTLITSVNRCIKKIRNEEMAEFDLKSKHLSCIYYIYKNKKLTATQLCDICLEDKANISRSIKYLVDHGFLTQSSSKVKNYQCYYKLTDKGAAVAKIINEKINNILSKSGAGLSEEERIIMYRALEVVSNNLINICDNYTNGGNNNE